MRRISCVLAFVTMFWASGVFAQEQWLNLTPPFQKALGFQDVHFTNPARGFIVGDSGYIFKTVDTAATWTQQVSGVAGNLYGLDFADSNTALAVGADGVILRTTNGGSSWVARSSGVLATLRKVHFMTLSRAIAVGDSGVILRSTNGGLDWTLQRQAHNFYYGFVSIAFSDTLTGYIAGPDQMFKKTSDGGASWTDVPFASSQGYEWWTGIALAGNTLFANGTSHDRLYKSTNGGSSWTVDFSSSKENVYFANADTGYVFSGGPDVYKTTNGGATWGVQTLFSGFSGDINSMFFLDGKTGYAVGKNVLNNPYRAAILKHVYTPPVTPAPLAPVNGLVDAALSLNLSWSVVPHAATYHVQVSTDAGFGTLAFEDSTLLSATVFLENLSTSTVYHWRVRAKNYGGVSAWSTVRSFTTVPPPPAVPPVLATPVSGATNVAVSNTLSWASVAGATAYRLQLSTDAGFTAIVKDTTQAGLSKAMGPLTNATTYFWRVNAQNPGGASAFSSGSSFTTVPIPAAPVPSAPATAAVNVALSPTLSWAAATHALTYRVQLSTDPAFGTTLVNDSTLTGTSRAVGPLANSTTYHWRVNAKHGGTSAYSASMSFTTQPAAPGATTLSAPAASATNISLNPTLSWTAVSAATSYRVQVSVDPGFGTTVVDDSSATGTSIAVGPLQPGTVYYWRVAARNGGGSSAFTANRSFTTVPAIPAVPTLASPGNGATGVAVAPTLAWGTVGGATNYSVQISRDSTFATVLLTDTTLTAASRAVSGLMYNMTYYWRAGARNVGGSSGFSLASRFTTAALTQPVTTAPASNAAGVSLSPTLTWNAVAGATTYHVQFSTDSTFASTLVNDSTPTAGSRGVGPLTAGAAYFWRVRARSLSGLNELSLGDWSGTQKFTVLALPAVPALSSPGADTTGAPTSLNLAWLSAAGAATYRVQLATDSLFSAPVVNDSTLTATTRAVGPLNNGTRYYWRVNAKNGSGTSAYAAYRAFTTAAIPAPILSAPAANATGQSAVLTLSWNASSGAAVYTVQVSVDSLFSTTVVNDLSAAVTRQVGPLAAGASLYWRVRAENGASQSTWSEVRRFSVMAVPPAPVLLSPGADSTGVPLSPTLAWNASAGASTYRVQLAVDSTFAAVLVSDSTLTGTTRAVGPLSNGVTYYWRVNSKNGGGTSAWSPTRRFVTVQASALLAGERAFRSLSRVGRNDMRFDLPLLSNVRIRLYGLNGEAFATLVDGKLPAGSHTLSLPEDRQGVYLMDFRAGNFQRVLKLTD
jgi:photosystem II stability/assembly factor-like uncharacterized protein